MLKNTGRLNIVNILNTMSFLLRITGRPGKNVIHCLGKNKTFTYFNFLCNINAIFQKFLKLSRNTMALNVFIKLCKKFM